MVVGSFSVVQGVILELIIPAWPTLNFTFFPMLAYTQGVLCNGIANTKSPWTCRSSPCPMHLI